MQVAKGFTIASLLFLTACAVGGEGVKEDFVEIPNPFITMSPNAPATVWVPRSYVESSVPRGGELVKQGVEKLRSTAAAPAAATANAAPSVPAAPPSVAQAATAPVAATPAAATPQAPLRAQSRVALLEAGDNGLVAPLGDDLKSARAGIILDPARSASMAATADLGSPLGRSALSLRLQQKYGTAVVLFLSAPEGVAAGKSVQATVYDGMGGSEVTTLSAPLHPFTAGDPVAKRAAVSQALAEITREVKATVALLPWYSKVVAVEGDRVYIGAGSEAGLWIGQQLVLHRSGKVVAGLGYAPGERIGTLDITGFVGTNGAYGEVKGGKEVKAEDLVTLE